MLKKQKFLNMFYLKFDYNTASYLSNSLLKSLSLENKDEFDQNDISKIINAIQNEFKHASSILNELVKFQTSSNQQLTQTVNHDENIKEPEISTQPQIQEEKKETELKEEIKEEITTETPPTEEITSAEELASDSEETKEEVKKGGKKKKK